MRVSSAILAIIASAAAMPALAEGRSSFALAEWVGTVERQLDERLSDPRFFTPLPDPRVVVVRFNRGADGRPDGAAVQESSGSAEVDQRALEVVSSLDALPALPAGYPGSMPISMRVLFEANGDERAFNEARAKRVALQETRRKTNTSLAARYERDR